MNSQSALAAVVGFFVGAAVTLLFCWFSLVGPLSKQLVAREKAAMEWERINRQERDTVATLKTISTDELKKWVATIDEQNVRFATLQSLLHKQELELSGPATAYIVIASAFLTAITILIVVLFRDANSSAATTIENVASLAPEAMVRSLLTAHLAKQEPITLEVSNPPTSSTMPSHRRLAFDDRAMDGEVVEFFQIRDSASSSPPTTNINDSGSTLMTSFYRIGRKFSVVVGYFSDLAREKRAPKQLSSDVSINHRLTSKSRPLGLANPR